MIKLIIIIAIIVLFSVYIFKCLRNNTELFTDDNSNKIWKSFMIHEFEYDDINTQSSFNTDNLLLNSPVIDYNINMPGIFNENWNKPWMKEQVSYNDKYIQDIPHSSKFITSFEENNSSLISSYDENEIIRLLITNNSQDLLKKINNFNISGVKSKELDLLNRKTWINRLKSYNPNDNFILKKIKSDMPYINKCLTYIEKNINILLLKAPFMKKKNNIYGFQPYFVYKYKISKMMLNDKNDIIYDLIIVLLREPSTLGVTIWVKIIALTSNIIFIVDTEVIGSYVLQDLFDPPGITSTKEENLILNKFYRDEPGLILNPEISEYILNKRNKTKLDDTKYQYSCFSTDLDLYNNLDTDVSEQFIRADSKQQCESNTDWYGRPKPHGIWDRPCKDDNDCYFYKANTNYKNNFGKCLSNGYCEVPLNMLNLGYRYTVPSKDKKPLCYNCNSKSWNLVTKLDTCCNDQWNKKKYPFLTSPDFAYQNDLEKRQQSYYASNCKQIINYKNIFSKEPSSSHLVCKTNKTNKI